MHLLHQKAFTLEASYTKHPLGLSQEALFCKPSHTRILQKTHTVYTDARIFLAEHQAHLALQGQLPSTNLSRPQAFYFNHLRPSTPFAFETFCANRFFHPESFHSNNLLQTKSFGRLNFSWEHLAFLTTGPLHLSDIRLMCTSCVKQVPRPVGW